MKQKKYILILSLVIIFLVSTIIYLLLQIKKEDNLQNSNTEIIKPDNLVTLKGKYIEIKVPSNWVELSSNDGSVMYPASKSLSFDQQNTIFGIEDGQYIVMDTILKDRINTSNTNGDVLQAEINSLTENKSQQYTNEEIKIGNTIFQKITVPHSNSGGVTETYIAKLKNNSGVIIFNSEDNKLLLKILETVKVY